MYVICLLLLFISVYLAPALAFAPQLIYKPSTVIAIPILSSLLVVILATVLLSFNLFNHETVLWGSIFFLLLALFRMGKLCLHKPLEKNIFGSGVLKLLCFNFLLMLPFFVKLGTHSFSQGDEIYSWNYWAIQHYLNLSPNFEHTGAPYPQFLPKLLAYQYHLVGNIDYQLPIKALLGLFSFTLLNTFALAYRHNSQIKKIKYGLIILWAVFGIGLQHFFNDGYADPIMCASLILSVYYAWLAYKFKHIKNEYWALSVATGMVAAYAKQPGLLWLGVVLPIGYLLFNNKDKKNILKLGLFLCCTTGVALLWFLTEGKNFQDNTGVISASLGQRDVYAHIYYIIEFYFLRQPMLGLFLGLSLIGLLRYIFIKNPLNKSLKKQKFVLYVTGLLLLPYLLLWLTFGAYQLRLGQHVVALLCLLIMLTGYRGLWLFNFFINLFLEKIKKYRIICSGRKIYIGLAGISVLASILIAYKQESKVMTGIPWQNAGQRTLHTYFGKDSEKIFHTLYNKTDIVLWVPTRYVYGMFYGHTPVIMPKDHWTVEDFVKNKANYLVTASKEIASAQWTDDLNKIIQACPDAFNQINTTPNRYKLVTYQLNQANLETCFL